MESEKAEGEIIVCRCEDVTLEEIEAAIDRGITNPEELKRFLHVGMGPCQGRTCGRLISQILARKTGKPISSIKSTTHRPPLISVPISKFLGEGNE